MLRLTCGVALSVLGFGAVVSLASFSRTSDLNVQTAPSARVRVDEISRLYPVEVSRVVVPHSTAEIAAAVRESSGPVSVGGGRNSMGGQTATPHGIQIDLRDYRGVVAFDAAARTITVRSGTRWREVQEKIDPAGLAVKIMQTYNTFTVGGALSVNCHGRYVGQGPMIQSVRGLTLVLADGRVVSASRTENPDLFYAAVGGYGAVGVIADVTLDLAEDARVRREDEVMTLASYPSHFFSRVRNDGTVIFHNADIYPPDYTTIHAVSYRLTDDAATVADHLRPTDQASWMHRSAYWMITGWPKGPWIRQHLLDPILFRGHPVTWRNYEASYDVSELEPVSREKTTYVLQEYFVPVQSFQGFAARMREILVAHRVRAVNVSIRHAVPDHGSFLSWAPEDEVFAFVLYYNQRTDSVSRHEVGRWTRELIDAAIASGGRYYLPYQPVATRRQFAAAYPHSNELFAVKRRVDPEGRFTNTLWDLYAPDSSGAYSSVRASNLPAVLSAEARITLDQTADYDRDESAELMTHPEWDLVYSSEAYAQWLEKGKPPSGFPFVSCVGTFWRSYYGTWSVAHRRQSIGLGSHVLLNVIGISTAVEYGLKEVYENTFGRLSELAMPAGGTEEDRYSAKVAREYVGLIARAGWYEFDFGRALRELWTTVPARGHGLPRKWERRFALSAEYGIKAAYAAVIGLGTRLSYTPDVIPRGVVAAGWDGAVTAGSLKMTAPLDRGYTLLSVDRYNPFRDSLVSLSEHHDTVRLAEVCGSERVALVGTAPRGWIAPSVSTVVVAYATPADDSRTRILLEVGARDLLDVLHELRAGGQFQIEHIYDY